MSSPNYPINFETIPESVRILAQWVCWKAVARPNGKIIKIPINPRTGRNASTKDPKTWGSFDDAWQGVILDGYDGIGFVFVIGDGLVGIDLDNCMGPDGKLKKWAQDIVDRLGSYTEVSPSGNGVHVLCFSDATGISYNKDGREMYSEGRYFTFTGNEYHFRSQTNENK